MSYKVGIAITSVVVALLIFFILMANSYNLSIWAAGYSTNAPQIIYESLDNNGEPIRLVQLVKRGTSEKVLAQLVKNKWNWWYLQLVYDQQNKHGMTQLYWMKFLSLQNFIPLGATTIPESITQTEQHVIFIGDNATDLIRFEEGQLPDQMTVGIQQSSEEYILHFVSLGDWDEQMRRHDELQSNLYNILKENGCVK